MNFGPFAVDDETAAAAEKDYEAANSLPTSRSWAGPDILHQLKHNPVKRIGSKNGTIL